MPLFLLRAGRLGHLFGVRYAHTILVGLIRIYNPDHRSLKGLNVPSSCFWRMIAACCSFVRWNSVPDCCAHADK